MKPPKVWVHHDLIWMSSQAFLDFCRPPSVEEVKVEPLAVLDEPRVLKKDDLDKAFNEIDEDGNGTLEPHELKKVFEKAGYKVTEAQIEMAMKCLDENDDGVIDKQEFQKLSKIITEGAVDAAVKPQRAKARSKTSSSDDVLSSLMGDYLLQGMMATVMNPDYEMNASADSMKKKRASLADLDKMLEDSVPKYQLDDGPQLSAIDLKMKLRKNFEQVMTTFRRYDADNSGTIDMVEWTAAICGLFKKANSEDVENLFREFDEDGGGTIDYEEFAFTLRAAKEKKKKGKKSSRRIES